MIPVKVKGKLAILLISSKNIYNDFYRRFNLIEYSDGTLSC